MRINPELRLRKLGKHYMIVDSCIDSSNVTNVYVLNDTAAWLWEQVAGSDFTANHLVELLCESYEVDTARAAADVETLIKEWDSHNLLIHSNSEIGRD